jgi:glycosyltransferase involved in cell wall biosynthesis
MASASGARDVTLGRCAVLVPGDWHTRTGGYGYDRHIADGLCAAGWQVQRCDPGDGYPWPQAGAVAQAAAAVAALPDGLPVIADGLAFGALPQLAAAHAARLRWVALVHHPLAAETGLNADQQSSLWQQERQALACAWRVVATSATTARALQADYAVPADRLRVVRPGTQPAAWSRGGGAGADAVSLLCVATVTARKGHAVLLQALAGLRERRWQLHCVGSLAREPHTAVQLTALAEQLGLADRVHWHGDVDAARLAQCYDQADLFVLPSWHEGYGMALAEALAHGLPVLTSTAGAIPETVPAAAGRLLAPGDVQALRAALAQAMDEPAQRALWAAGARAAAAQLPRWPQAVAAFDALLQECNA